MKKNILIVLCLVCALALAACGGSSVSKAGSDALVGADSRTWGPAESAGSAVSGEQIANPFQDCTSLAQAAEIAGFEMTVPDSISGYTQGSIQAIDKQMIQVFYSSGDDSILLRKASGSDDISGDYNTYAQTNTVTVGSIPVTMKGSSDTVSVAAWTDGGYAYAIDISGTGLSADAVTALVAEIG